MKRIIALLLATLVFVLLPVAGASPVAASPTTPAVAPFHVNSIVVSVSPSTLALSPSTTWPCGSTIQVVYTAVFHLTSGPTGGLLKFSTTTNNGRGQQAEQLTILPGQRQTDFVFTWQGALPADHTQPGLGGVLVTSPNMLVSPLVAPTGTCR